MQPPLEDDRTNAVSNPPKGRPKPPCARDQDIRPKQANRPTPGAQAPQRPTINPHTPEQLVADNAHADAMRHHELAPSPIKPSHTTPTTPPRTTSNPPLKRIRTHAQEGPLLGRYTPH